MLAVPPALLDVLHLGAGAKVDLAVKSGRLIVERQERPRYTLEEILSQCDSKAPIGREERGWLASEAVGGEFI